MIYYFFSPLVGFEADFFFHQMAIRNGINFLDDENPLWVTVVLVQI